MKKGNWMSGMAVLAMVCVASPAYALISVDFVVGTWNNPTGSSGVCSDDTTTTPGTPMTNADGIIFTGQVGPWNALRIGCYSYGSAQSDLLNDGAGNPTTVKLAMGSATGVTDPGNWRCSPNEATPDSIFQLRSESAYLYGGVLTGDHYTWLFTGLEPNAAYKLVWFGQGGGTSNVANGVPGVKDTENDWNWDTVTADAAGTILGTFTGWQTPGLYGAQLDLIGVTPPTWPNYLPGDFNKDGQVGPEDFGILKDTFGTSNLAHGQHESWTIGDANDDGQIGPEDFGLLKDSFGLSNGPTGTYPLANVPEPITLTLLAAALPMLLKRRAKA